MTATAGTAKQAKQNLRLKLQRRNTATGLAVALSPESTVAELAEAWIEDVRVRSDLAGTKDLYRRELNSLVLPTFKTFRGAGESAGVAVYESGDELQAEEDQRDEDRHSEQHVVDRNVAGVCEVDEGGRAECRPDRFEQPGCGGSSRLDQTVWPTFQKKLMSVTDAPQMIAAAQDTSTPSLPRAARCGVDAFDPRPHTIAEMINASTPRMSPMS